MPSFNLEVYQFVIAIDWSYRYSEIFIQFSIRHVLRILISSIAAVGQELRLLII